MSSINLELNEKDAREMLAFFQEKRLSFMQENSVVFNKLQEYNDMIEKLESFSNKPDLVDYPLGASWNQRIQYFLKKQPDGLTARSLTNLIATIEGIKDQNGYKKYYASVSPTLSAGTGVIYNRKNNKKGDYVYSIKEKSPNEGA